MHGKLVSVILCCTGDLNTISVRCVNQCEGILVAQSRIAYDRELFLCVYGTLLVLTSYKW